jgi:hypothetical protein
MRSTFRTHLVLASVPTLLFLSVCGGVEQTDSKNSLLTVAGDGGTHDGGTPDSGVCPSPTFIDAQLRAIEPPMGTCTDSCPADAGVHLTYVYPESIGELMALATVGDPPPPQPTGCRCPKVQIRCTGGKDDTAKCDPVKCVITFSADECKNLGYNDGDVKNTDTLNPADVSKDTDQLDIKDKCTAEHEGLHACQRPNTGFWCNEKDGYQHSVDCLQRGMDANNCGKGPWKIPSLCNDLNNEKTRMGIAKTYMDCRCSGKSKQTCLDQCKGDGKKPLRVQWCDKIANTYEPQAPKDAGQ